MPTVRREIVITEDIECEIWCSCGEGLCGQTKTERRDKGFIVEPCQKCLAEAETKGYELGKEQNGV